MHKIAFEHTAALIDAVAYDDTADAKGALRHLSLLTCMVLYTLAPIFMQWTESPKSQKL